MISIIIVSYNRLDLIKKCLSHCPKDCEIILVDNNSTEPVVDFVKKNYPKVNIIANKENAGFAIGNNQGMKLAKGDYFLLVNTDAFIKKDTADKLESFAKLHPDAGVIAPKILNDDGSLQPSAGYFPNLWTVFLIMSTIDNWPIFKKFLPSIHVRENSAFEKIGNFEWITAACMMVPRPVFEKTKGFSNNYFMYGEELEWEYRITKLGYKNYYLPDIKVTHLGFSSSSPANGAIKELQSYLAFFKKYKPNWQIPVLKAIIIGGCLLRICRGLVQPKHRWMVSGYWSAIFKIL